MSSSSDFSDASEGEMEERVEKIYTELKEKKIFTSSSHGSLSCPFCLGGKGKGKDYRHRDLLQHATGVGNSNKRLKETAKHRALAKFLQLDFVEKPEPSLTPLPPITPEPKHFKQEAWEEHLVWPWMGIVVNIQAKGKDGRHFATASRLKDEFARFNPVRAHPLWDDEGFRGVALIEFNKGWSGYHNASSFERSFQMDGQGKKEWIQFHGHGSSMHGWMAREDDYNSADEYIRGYLRKHCDLKTVTELEDEEKRKKDVLVDVLQQTLDLKNEELESSRMRLKEVTYVLEQTKASLVEKENDMARLMDQYNEALDEFEACQLELEKERKELAGRQRELLEREAENDYEKKKIEYEKEQYAAKDANLQAASMEQKKTDENLTKLLEDLKVEIHYVREIDEMFDGISYKKGASLIRMLQSYLEAETFQRSLAAYTKKYACINAKTDDLWAVLSEESGQPVNELMDSWTKQKGYPVIHVKVGEDALEFEQLCLSLSIFMTLRLC